jgi:hypothetical protein
MNDERAAIINMVIQKQLAAAEAALLLDALLRLEMGEEWVIEPPCRRPPWWEVDRDLDALYNAPRKLDRGISYNCCVRKGENEDGDTAEQLQRRVQSQGSA